MRRLVFFLSFLVPLPAYAAPNYVQSLGTCAISTAATTCTLTPTHTSTAGHDIIVGSGWKTTTRSITSVTTTASGATFVPYVGEQPNSTNNVPSIWICHKCPSITTANNIKITWTGTTVGGFTAEEYSGVTAYGTAAVNTGNTSTPNNSSTLQDANNIVVTMFVGTETAGGYNFSASTGNLRDQTRTSTGTTQVAIGFCDNTNATPGNSPSCQVSAGTTVQWSAVSLELRSNTSPMTDHVESYGTDASSESCCTQNSFKAPLSNDPTLAGNLSVCLIMWPGSSNESPNSITDDKGDTFSKAIEEDDASQMDAAIYYVKTTTGAHLLQFSFATAIAISQPVGVSCSNFNNASATVDQTCGGTAISTGPNLTCGSMTTTVTDIIFVASLYDNSGAWNFSGQAMGPCREGYQFTLLIPANEPGYCTEYGVVSAGTINPAIYSGQFGAAFAGSSSTPPTNSPNQWTMIGAAFEVSAGGTAPSGMYIARQWQPSPSNHTIYVNCASSGDFVTSAPTTAPTGQSVIDSNQVTWTQDSPHTVGAFFYSTNSQLDPSSMCKMADAAGGNEEFTFYDIVGAATSNPVVVPSACPSPSSLTNAGTNKGCANGSATVSGSQQTDLPNHTPNASGDLILVAGSWGTGPTISALQPSCFLDDLGSYTTQGDGNGWGFGEGHGHCLTTSASTLNFGYNMGSGSGTPSTGSGWSIEIAPAPTGGGVTIIPALPLLGAGVGE